MPPAAHEEVAGDEVHIRPHAQEGEFGVAFEPGGIVRAPSALFAEFRLAQLVAPPFLLPGVEAHRDGAVFADVGENPVVASAVDLHRAEIPARGAPEEVAVDVGAANQVVKAHGRAPACRRAFRADILEEVEGDFVAEVGRVAPDVDRALVVRLLHAVAEAAASHHMVVAFDADRARRKPLKGRFGHECAAAFKKNRLSVAECKARRVRKGAFVNDGAARARCAARRARARREAKAAVSRAFEAAS